MLKTIDKPGKMCYNEVKKGNVKGDRDDDDGFDDIWDRIDPEYSGDDKA